MFILSFSNKPTIDLSTNKSNLSSSNSNGNNSNSILNLPYNLVSGSTFPSNILYHQNSSQSNQALNPINGSIIGSNSNSPNNVVTASSKTNFFGSSSGLNSNQTNFNSSGTSTSGNSVQTGANIVNTNSR